MSSKTSISNENLMLTNELNQHSWQTTPRRTEIYKFIWLWKNFSRANNVSFRIHLRNLSSSRNDACLILTWLFDKNHYKLVSNYKNVLFYKTKSTKPTPVKSVSYYFFYFLLERNQSALEHMFVDFLKISHL